MFHNHNCKAQVQGYQTLNNSTNNCYKSEHQRLEIEKGLVSNRVQIPNLCIALPPILSLSYGVG